MTSKNKCWMCERGTGLDNGGLQPGELTTDDWGDTVCVRCKDKIDFTAKLMAQPELIPLMTEIDKLPKVEGVTVGLKFDEEMEQ